MLAYSCFRVVGLFLEPFVDVDLTADKYEVLGSTPMKVRESTKTSGAGTRDKVGTRFNIGAV